MLIIVTEGIVFKKYPNVQKKELWQSVLDASLFLPGIAVAF